MVRVAVEFPYAQGCVVVILLSPLILTLCPILIHDTVGIGLPSNTQLRLTMFVSLVVVLIGGTKITGGSKILSYVYQY
jgi:hypothetical protein